MVPVVQDSKECVASECDQVSMSTPLSDMLSASEPDPDPPDVYRDPMDALDMEAGFSSTGQNVEMTPMSIDMPVALLTPQCDIQQVSLLEPVYSDIDKDPMDDLAKETRTSSTGPNVEVISRTMPPPLHDGEPSSVSRKLKV